MEVNVPGRLRTLSRVLPAVFVAAAALSGCDALGLGDSAPVKAAAPPENLCSLISDETLQRVVPGAKTPFHGGEKDDEQSRATCAVATDAASRPTPHADLSVHLIRTGSVLDRSPDGAARQLYQSLKKVKIPGHTDLEEIEGLGEEAFASHHSSAEKPEAVSTSLTVRRGTDVIGITYFLNPAATPDEALDNAKKIAAETLANV